MQNAVLRRPGTENTRVPNFLYIDEFPDFICKEMCIRDRLFPMENL